MTYKLLNFDKKDIWFLFKLKNDKDNIKNSINSKRITKKQHKIWFFRKLKSRNDKIFIIKKKNKKIGYIRFDKKKSFYEVSIALIKKFRGKKLSTKFLLEAENNIESSKFTAKIRHNNHKSFALFKSANYSYKRKKRFILMKKNLQNKDISKKYLKIINKIQEIRKKNNKNWMDVLKIAFRYSPKEASKIMSSIYTSDRRIAILTKNLTKK
jgi:RimJ/RimL family protein N-acetyltransferase|tara:strand:+ start:2639 stop:3271 length:633 start_codon:yes stop_codon:yes gene_type:complete